jgi:Zn-dependent protease/CBS domain-containing protein
VISLDRGVVRIRRLGAVQLEFHVGWLLAGAALVTLTAIEFARIVSEPGTSDGVFLILAVTTGAGILVSFAAHDAGHVLVHRITHSSRAWLELFPFGTAPADLDVPPGQRQELFVALAGPAVSGLTGALLGGLLAIAEPDGAARRLVLVLLVTNGAIFIASLMPIHPLDGGRVIRALFWYLHSSFLSGVRAAFLFSQFFGTAVLGYGIFLLSWDESYLTPGLWCVVGGWALTRASRKDLLRATLIERASAALAEDAVRGFNPTVRASAPLAEAIDVLLEQAGHGPGLVREATRFTGVLTLSQIRGIPRREWANLTASDAAVSTEGLPVTEPGASLVDAARLLRESEQPWVLVTDQRGEIIGALDGEVGLGQLLRRATTSAVEVPR